MAEILRSVGLDVGTTSTQMILSELTVENRASSFAVPELEIAGRRILYRSPVRFTPLLDTHHIDGPALKALIAAEYEAAGITRDRVDTGAVIITGETARKENARTALEALSDLAGDFVVATAGPDLESLLAARGAGAVAYSEKTGQTVLHFDIGGGTSNLALIQGGTVAATGCLDVGGRLVKIQNDRITYVSPVLTGLTPLAPGDDADPARLDALCALLARVLETAANRAPESDAYRQLLTENTVSIRELVPPDAVISFSGGVADCIDTVQPPDRFGDIGPRLGRAIRAGKLCAGPYRLGEETIRATVIGAGCHSAQLSGSTVFHRGVTFPLKNLAAVPLSSREQALPREDLAALVRQRLSRQEQAAVVALPGLHAPDYRQITALAEGLAAGFGPLPALVVTEADMAKALGQALALRRPPEAPCLCLDRIRLTEGSYLDVGAPVGPALPVVVKTLILSNEEGCYEA